MTDVWFVTLYKMVLCNVRKSAVLEWVVKVYVFLKMGEKVFLPSKDILDMISIETN